MSSAISINIGLNHVDTSAYPDYEIPVLSGCINDAKAMQGIAENLGYVTTLLCDEEATADRVIGEIGQAALNLDPGGILLLTYSGHGGQMEDVNGDEDDGLDETWILYDRQLIDDELYNLWSQFGSKSRIVVLSDSCHSGSISRQIEYKNLAASQALGRQYRNGVSVQGASGQGISGQGMNAPGLSTPRFKSISEQAARADFKRNRARYTALQFAAGGNKRRDAMEACVLLISGCQDNQLSGDGDVNGTFTGTLLDVWGNGSFSGSYRAFHKAIVAKMPATQTPNYMVIGRKDPDMEAQVPFTVAAADGESPAPTPAPIGSAPEIEGPPLVHRDDPPPTFEVNVGRGRYYAVELASDASLFAGTDARRDDNFYGSWSDTALMEDQTYPLPAAVWDRLKYDDRLYYRVLSSARRDAWDDYQVSGGGGADVPMMQVEA